MSGVWKDLISAAAEKHAVDPERAWVWEMFSQVYLDTTHTDAEVQTFAENLAASPFSTSELAHIAFHEVNPVCTMNVFYWEWGGFDTDWLISNCKKRQNAKPFEGNTNPDEIPLFMLVFSPFWMDSSNLIDRVKRIRQS